MNSLSDLISDIVSYQHSSAGIQFKILDYQRRVLNNEIEIVDPTNPFIFLLEAGAAGTAASTLNLERNLRKRYVSLAQKMDDLYYHMCDEDYLDVFALPSTGKFTFILQLDTLLSSLVDYPDERVKRVRLPRSTTILFKDYAFRLTYPLVIEVSYSGQFKIQYDVSLKDNYFVPETEIVDYHITKNTDGSKWLVFTVEAPQLSVAEAYFTAHTGAAFKQSMTFVDDFHKVKVLHNVNGKWIDLTVTFSEEIYDPNIPTATCKLLENTIEVTIPSVYVTNGLLQTNLLVQVWSTKGPVVINPTDINSSDFSVDFTTSDPSEQTDDVLALQSVSITALMSSVTSGGRRAKTYDEVKQSCINNTLGIPDVPITEIQLADSALADGFTLVKNVDRTTNRIYKALQDLPLISSTLPRPNLTSTTVLFTEETGELSRRVVRNGNRSTLLSNTLFSVIEANTTIVSDATQKALMSSPLEDVVKACRDNNLRFTPFHYVFDSTTPDSNLTVRPYLLDDPVVSRINYKYLNLSAQISITVTNTQIKRIENGFRLYVETISNDLFKQLPDTSIHCLAYLSGQLVAYTQPALLGKSTTGELTYQIDLITDYDIADNHHLALTNFSYINNASKVFTALDSCLTLSFMTTARPTSFIPSDPDSLYKPDFIPEDCIVISEQDLYLHLGDYLPWIWRKELKLITDSSFERHAIDVPLRRIEDVYELDPKTNSIFSVGTRCQLEYNLLHQAGDIVYDGEEIVYKYKAGDIKLVDNNPVLKTPIVYEHKLDFITLDAAYLLASDPDTNNMLKEARGIFTSWSNDKLERLNKQTLENTELYYAAKYLSTFITVKLDGETVKDIGALQNIVITAFTTDYVLKSPNIKSQLELAIKQVIQNSLQEKVIIKDVVRRRLFAACGDAVSTFKISGLVDDKVEIIEVLSDTDRLGLNKLPYLKPDGFSSVMDDLVVNFVLA